MNRRALTLGVVVVLVMLVSSSPGLAAPLYQARSVITYPANGMTLGGVVDVVGIATHPNMNFYQVRYAPGSEPTADSQWVDFAIVQARQVENDVLGSWDTTSVPDGTYTMALAVWGQDDTASPYVFFVTFLTVNNAQFLPSPTPPEEPPTPEPLPTEVIGPTPTPVLVEQPATPTPRPTATPAAVAEVGTETVESPEEETGPAFALDTAELREAFCAGGMIPILLLLVWGVYLLMKAGVRWLLRQRQRPPPLV
jgi:hypothetical protein